MSRYFFKACTAFALLTMAGSGYAQVHHSAHEPKSSQSGGAQPALPCAATSQCAGRTPPATMLELDDFISAHFEALHAQSTETPAIAAPAGQTPAKPQG